MQIDRVPYFSYSAKIIQPWWWSGLMSQSLQYTHQFSTIIFFDAAIYCPQQSPLASLTIGHSEALFSSIQRRDQWRLLSFLEINALIASLLRREGNQSGIYSKAGVKSAAIKEKLLPRQMSVLTSHFTNKKTVFLRKGKVFLKVFPTQFLFIMTGKALNLDEVLREKIRPLLSLPQEK